MVEVDKKEIKLAVMLARTVCLLRKRKWMGQKEAVVCCEGI